MENFLSWQTIKFAGKKRTHCAHAEHIILCDWMTLSICNALEHTHTHVHITVSISIQYFYCEKSSFFFPAPAFVWPTIFIHRGIFVATFFSAVVVHFYCRNLFINGREGDVSLVMFMPLALALLLMHTDTHTLTHIRRLGNFARSDKIGVRRTTSV